MEKKPDQNTQSLHDSLNPAQRIELQKQWLKANTSGSFEQWRQSIKKSEGNDSSNKNIEP